MDFFEQFNEARKEFTYIDADDQTDRKFLQVGLVATFYIDQCYLPHKRQGLADALRLYYAHYGDQFNWCDFEHREHQPGPQALEQCCQYIQDQTQDICFSWSSESDGWLHVGSYAMDGLSMQDWFEQVHRDVSYFSFYLPVEALENEGRQQFEDLLLACCNLLQPLHGVAGLGMQVCNENEEFQDLEYEVAQDFNCIDIGSPSIDKYLRTGFRTINWYTILADQWIEKLGGAASLQQQMNDERIALLPFNTGMMIRAGEWPELGWARRNPYPELYVKVNDILKPLRAPVVPSFHYGSISGEIRFDTRSSNEWLSRLDRAENM